MKYILSLAEAPTLYAKRAATSRVNLDFLLTTIFVSEVSVSFLSLSRGFFLFWFPRETCLAIFRSCQASLVLYALHAVTSCLAHKYG
jgi:hypothetical protein